MEKFHRTRQRVDLRVALLACIALSCCHSTFALNPELDINQYAHTSWKIREGFTKGQTSTVAQTADGYLWLGTEFGLLRFDGVRAVPWQPPSGERLPAGRIGSLLAARDGTLWIGTDKGLASWQHNKLTLWPELTGQIVWALMEDHEGAIWAGSIGVPTGRLCAIQKGRADCAGEDGAVGSGATGLYEDKKGNVWVGVVNGILRWKPGVSTFYSLPNNPNGIRSFSEDYDDDLLIGTSTGVIRFVSGKIESYWMATTPQQLNANKLLRDRDGGFWIATDGQGLVHVHQGKTDVYTQLDGLSGDRLVVIFEDREGNIWVATNKGLDRFHDVSVSTFSAKQGFADGMSTVLADRDGSVWLAAPRVGLFRWLKGQFTIFGERGTPRTTAGVKRDSRQSGVLPNSIFEDPRGRIWTSTVTGIGYFENDRFISVSGIPGGPVHSIAADASGNIWIANQDSGLYVVSPEGNVQHIPWTQLGRNDFANAVAGDLQRKGVWLGFYHGGIAYFEDGRIRASYSGTDGLGKGNVFNFRLDPDGTLWIATEGGLSRLKNGQVATLTSKNGLACDPVHWVIEDDDHYFWLSSPCGLERIARTELDAWAVAMDRDKNSTRMVQPTLFDSSNGLQPLAVCCGYSPVAAKSLDGRLWFKAPDGVSVVDPRHLAFNKLPPPVHIEQIVADHQTYEATSEANGRVSLPPLIRDLQIDYTALSLVAPEKIRFRYKLEGYDKDWQDVGNRRQAFYTNLPPRNYRFRVMACNNSGVWNETGAFLDFAIAPAYYQSTWFRVVLGVAFVLVLAALYQMRVRQVAATVRGRMEERLAERERIARDLHDTFLQGVQGLILKFDAAAKQIPPDEPARQAMDNALDRADEVMAEGRDRVRNLRDTNLSLGDLPTAFTRVVDENSQDGKVTFRTVVEGRVRELSPIVLEESYCIGREALINALAHSQGHNVEAEFTYSRQQFRLRIRDDGRGIESEILEAGGRPGHFGLQGMRERADRINAQLKLWSGADTGTEVELLVPATTAYGKIDREKSRSWFRFR
jgi:signal transduction histidine kinase/ligand-binding sensor domain-containing protein